MTTQILTATPDDAPVLAELSRPVQDLHVSHRPTQFKQTRVEEVRDWFASMLAKPSVTAWLAHVDGHPAGYLLSVTYSRPENPFCLPRAYCEVDQVCVAPQYRRQGVATALFEAVFAHARQTPLESVQLSCWSFNDAAQAAFRSLGFRHITSRFERRL
jgi:ribosomal protein S18 acetylase RimI-like enzyme